MSGRNRFLPLLLRIAGALAMIGTLTGGLSVSCAGDSTPGGSGGGSNAPNSASMGQWTPAAQDTCTKAFHDTFFVVGPDGKKYPTWHRAVESDPATNQSCSFGHDHGANPTSSGLSSALKQHFAFDTNRNGMIDSSELAVSGIPFGLVSEQLVNSTTPRIEDHTAYKIVVANDALRPRVSGGTGQTFDLRCDVLMAYNQPTSTADAFASNMFSVTYAVDCNNGNDVAQYPVKLIVSAMAVYGQPGSFTLDANNTQQPGTGTPVPTNSPAGGSELGRRIPTSDSVFATAFVAAGQTSNFNGLVERWDTQLRLVRANNAEIATLAPSLRVEGPARYYDLINNALARSVNLCYSGLNAAGTLISNPLQAGTIVRQVRNHDWCTQIAPNGPATPTDQRVLFDDTDSTFKGCSRTASFGADVVKNGSGQEIWYTDAFGKNGNSVAFANSIKQSISVFDSGTLVLGQVSAQQTCLDDASVHVPN